jgi:hypothetical protein
VYRDLLDDVADDSPAFPAVDQAQHQSTDPESRNESGKSPQSRRSLQAYAAIASASKRLSGLLASKRLKSSARNNYSTMF